MFDTEKRQNSTNKLYLNYLKGIGTTFTLVSALLLLKVPLLPLEIVSVTSTAARPKYPLVEPDGDLVQDKRLLQFQRWK
ncbi:hypothetical protein RCL_jg25133.t1 [Rhizophagus clarus]|uniref:Uncharacterized protein n=1 Tax=Rhizophagus clarus TaxID=94130 RepID=A0A8H3LQC5_9GLOM|nr:hypothetical protein RCL_jg25133.t1 [Rhizophagus clarus]